MLKIVQCFPFSLWIKPKSLRWLSRYWPPPLLLSFSSSHCFSDTNFLATLQTHQAAAHSCLRAFALALPCTWNISPSQTNYLHSTLHYLQISAQMSPFSESSSLINPHSSLSFLSPYAALYFSTALITTCHIFIGLFVYCLLPQVGL